MRWPIGPALALSLLWPAAVAVPAGGLAPATGPAAAAGWSAPCNPSAGRTVAPVVVAEEGTLQVRATFDHACPVGQRRINLVFLQNGVPSGSGTGPEVSINENLRASILGFLDLMDPGAGSRAGYTAFTDGHRNQVPLAPPEEWPAQWGAWASPGLETSGLVSAMHDAAGRLPANPAAAGSENLVVAILSSSRPLGTPSDLAAACGALRAVGARMAVVSLEQMRGSGGLGDLTCIDWFLRSTDGQGLDLPRLFMDLAHTVLFSPTVESVELADAMVDAFGYVRRSATPREPDVVFGPDVSWVFSPPPAGPQTISYRVQAAVGWSALRTPLSREAYVTFRYSDGSEVRLDLPNPVVCIHPRNDEGYCAGLNAGAAYLPLLARRAGH